MTEWSDHVHRFAKKHKMTYNQARSSKKCKELYKKEKIKFRRGSPKRMNAYGAPLDPLVEEFKGYKTITGAANRVYELAEQNRLTKKESDRVMEKAGYADVSIERIHDGVTRMESLHQKSKKRGESKTIPRGKIRKFFDSARGLKPNTPERESYDKSNVIVTLSKDRK